MVLVAMIGAFRNENVFEEHIKLLKLDVMLRDNALVELRNKFETAKKERDELKHTLEKFQTSSKNLILHDAPNASETVFNMFNVEPSTPNPNKNLSQSNRPSALLIEDWVSDSEDESEGEPMPTQKASFMGFMVYQMDVKSAFIYETIKEEVYVCQPPGFEDPDYPDKVYMDDIIFGSTNKELCKAFKKLMKDKFQMSSMGELIFFLGLQVKQKDNGIFIGQDKYVAEILRKFGLIDGKSASTPIDTKKPLLKILMVRMWMYIYVGQ
nr:hypothetical protein [Tanacetum cinerariifolium]